MNANCKCEYRLRQGDKNNGVSFCSVRLFDSQGKLVFAICKHGNVILDLRPEPSPKKDRDAHPEHARESTLMKR